MTAPLTEADKQQLHQIRLEEVMAEMKQLAREVAAAWSSPQSGVDLIAEQWR